MVVLAVAVATLNNVATSALTVNAAVNAPVPPQPPSIGLSTLTAGGQGPLMGAHMSRSTLAFFLPVRLCSGALFLFLLSGCASQQIETREATPSVEIPHGWDLSANTGEQDWPDSIWWKCLGSDELGQLVT